MFLPYLPSADPLPTDDPDVYCAAFYSAILPNLANCLPTDVQWLTLGFYWGTASGLGYWRIQTPFTGAIIGSIPGGWWPSTFNVCISKRSALMDRTRGRLYVPYIPLTAMNEEHRLTPLGIANYGTLLFSCSNQVTSQGVTFTPASYISGAGVMDPVTKWILPDHATVFMRRGGRRNPGASSNPGFQWPPI
jgi:hypothetical protein